MTGFIQTSKPAVVHVFPGQGDFALRILRRAVTTHPIVRGAVQEVFAEVDVAVAELGIGPLNPLTRMPAQRTARAPAPVGGDQAALFAACLSTHVALNEAGYAPDRLAGVSFGEITALTAAGVFTVADGARICVKLARILPRDKGGLLWLSTGETEATRLLATLGDPRLSLGCVNGPNQCVISGSLTALAACQHLAEQNGVKASMLRLRYYAHHPDLASAASQFESTLRKFTMRPPRKAVFSAAHGRAYRRDEDIPHALAQCLVQTAHVPRMITAACAGGPALLFEAGTGTSATQGAAHLSSVKTRTPLADESFPWPTPSQLHTTDSPDPGRQT